jgi:para-nitrobenzyl esterase
MSNKEAVAETRAGQVEGSYRNGLYIFKGVPYAAPPVGELRWLPPQPVKPWQGVRQAKNFGTIAPQNPMEGGVMEGFQEEEPQGEDCLFLNIWTAGLDNARRPVTVWIHGGAFNLGSGSLPMYSGKSLAARGDAVVVTINYRLGALGFLRLKEVTGGKIPATGNEGLLDQVAALRWVRDNIAAFGGDPGNVTVFGESAGGMSIGCLLAMPSARGLFHKAILQSGVASVAAPWKEAVTVAGEFLAELGISGGDVEALRALTVEQILDTDIKLRTKMAAPGEQMRITVTPPVVDGEIIPEVPIEAIRRGVAKDIPVMAGTCLEEWKLFATMQPGLARLKETEMVKRLEYFIPAQHLPGLVEAYRKAREKRGAATSPVELLSAIQTDIMFRMPVVQFIEAQRDNQQLAYNYLFTWVSPVMDGILGACHVLDVGFVFSNYDDTFCGSGPDADRLSKCIQDAWLAFARTGDPSCDSIGNWPPYGDNRQTMMLGRDCHVEEAPYEDERRAWDIMPNIFNVLL